MCNLFVLVCLWPYDYCKFKIDTLKYFMYNLFVLVCLRPYDYCKFKINTFKVFYEDLIVLEHSVGEGYSQSALH